MCGSRNSRAERSPTSPWAICDYSSSRISSMVSPVPNIEATMAETQSNTVSLFAREPAGTDCGQCQCANTCYQTEAGQSI